jgi:hypothetical protein
MMKGQLDMIKIANRRGAERRAAGRNVHDLPAGLAAAMRGAITQVQVDLDEKLDGEVAI